MALLTCDVLYLQSHSQSGVTHVPPFTDYFGWGEGMREKGEGSTFTLIFHILYLLQCSLAKFSNLRTINSYITSPSNIFFFFFLAMSPIKINVTTPTNNIFFVFCLTIVNFPLIKTDHPLKIDTCFYLLLLVPSLSKPAWLSAFRDASEKSIVFRAWVSLDRLPWWCEWVSWVWCLLLVIPWGHYCRRVRQGRRAGWLGEDRGAAHTVATPGGKVYL